MVRGEEPLERGRSRELELGGEIRTPEILGFKVGLAAKYRRTWQERRQQLVHDAADEAGLTRAQLEQRLDDDDLALDVVARAADRAGEVADQDYRTTLARAVAQALLDDASVDQEGLLAAEVGRLEPVHLRALRAFVAEDTEGVEHVRREVRSKHLGDGGARPAASSGAARAVAARRRRADQSSGSTAHNTQQHSRAQPGGAVAATRVGGRGARAVEADAARARSARAGPAAPGR